MSAHPSEFLPSAGCLRLTGRAQLRLTGGDRAAFLHNFCTNDVKQLAAGQGCEAFLTNVKGRILGHIHVFVEPEAIVLDSVPGSAEPIRAHLDRYVITEDVTIADETDSVEAVYVFGCTAAAALAPLVGLDPSGFALWQHAPAVIAGAPASMRRIDFTAAPGFQCCTRREAAAPFVAALRDAGIPEVSEPDFEAFRIDAGFPRYGVDLSDDHLAQEAARTAKAVSFTKGCYLGQEPIARLDALGHVNRLLRRVVFEDGAEPQAGDRILDATSRSEWGTLTSVGRVRGSAAVGLGVLRTAAAPGAQVLAVGDSREVSGIVV